MSEHYYVGDAALAAPQIVLSADERVLWSGRCAVAEYAFDVPASLPRWTLPEETEVVISDQRVLYLGPGAAETGELRWSWPQHLRVQPGSRETGRQATVTQIQLVCAGPGGSFPALVFAGGDLATVRDADRVANLLRQAIARHRVEHAAELGIAPQQVRMLSRLVIGPEFNNFQGGEGQTVSLIGAVSVEAHAAPSALEQYSTAPSSGVSSPVTPSSAAPSPAAPTSAAPSSAAPTSVASSSGASSSAASVEFAAPGYAPVAPVVAPQSPAATQAASVLPSAWGGSSQASSARPSSPSATGPAAIPSAWGGSSSSAARDNSSRADASSAWDSSASPAARPARAGSSPSVSAPPGSSIPSAWRTSPSPAGRSARETSAPTVAGPSTSDDSAPKMPVAPSARQGSSSSAREGSSSALSAWDGVSPAISARNSSSSPSPASGGSSSASPAWDGSSADEVTAPLARDGSPLAWDSASSAITSAWENARPATPSSWDSPAPEAPDAGGRSAERTARLTPQREAWSARPAEESALHGHPDLDARAAELAARVANLVSGGAAPLGGQPVVDPENQTNLSAYLDVPPPAAPRPRAAAENEDETSGRAESVRRTAARFAGNAARGRGSAPRHDGEVGSSGRGSHRQG